MLLHRDLGGATLDDLGPQRAQLLEGAAAQLEPPHVGFVERPLRHGPGLVLQLGQLLVAERVPHEPILVQETVRNVRARRPRYSVRDEPRPPQAALDRIGRGLRARARLRQRYRQRALAGDRRRQRSQPAGGNAAGRRQPRRRHRPRRRRHLRDVLDLHARRLRHIGRRRRLFRQRPVLLPRQRLRRPGQRPARPRQRPPSSPRRHRRRGRRAHHPRRPNHTLQHPPRHLIRGHNTYFPVALTVVLCAACASYRVLPPPPLSGAAEIAPIPVRYEKTRLLFFKSSGDDGTIGRVWSDGATVLATVVSPEPGIYASGDGGASWTFAPGSFDFREVVFAKGRIWARGATRVYWTDDAGKSWTWIEVVRSGDWLDAMALGADGALYVAGRSQLYVTTDAGRSW